MKINIYMDDIRDVPDDMTGSTVWVPIRKAEDVIYLLKKGVVDDMSLDHDMGRDTYGELMNGYELLCWMERNNVWPAGNIRVHSANPVGAAKMRAVIEKRGEVV